MSAELVAVFDSYQDDVAAPIGTGCTPGGDTLPDGDYFGFVPVDTAGATSFQFDLACYYTSGRAAAAGIVRDGEDIVENESSKLREMTVAGGFVFWRLNSSAGFPGAADCTAEQPVDTESDLRCRQETILPPVSGLSEFAAVLRIRGGQVVEAAQPYLS